MKVISLFTGAGGMDLGLEAAGFETAVAVEMDDDAVRTLRHNRDWNVIHADIHTAKASSKNILNAGGLAVGEAKLLCGGPPCQPFSKSGYWKTGDSKRLDDPRARTLDAYLRVLRDTLPEMFLLENVPGMAFNEKSEGLQLIKREIARINEECGTTYSFAAQQLNAAQYGIPQTRERVFVIGHRDGKQFRFTVCRPEWLGRRQPGTQLGTLKRTTTGLWHPGASGRACCLRFQRVTTTCTTRTEGRACPSSGGAHGTGRCF